MVKIFISYSYDSVDHEKWVNKIADDLEMYEDFHVIYDKYDLTTLKDKNYFMESGVYDCDIILIICTENYTQKADNREGGVGIETYMATARHWEEFLKEKESSTLILLRDNKNKSVPRFMKGKIYINFNEDKVYNEKFHDLIISIQKKSKRTRPSKNQSIQDKEKILNLDKIKEILLINYKKINLISSDSDFSSNKKIKYEYWEAATPTKIYFLILFDNTTLKQTIHRFIEKVTYLPSEITVLRSQSTGYIEKLFHESNKRVKVNEFSFSQFMWEFCIDDNLKEVQPLYQDEYFIDQKIYKIVDSNKEIIGNSLQYIENNFINNLNAPAILLVLAPGGMGKSTLCDVLANKVNLTDNQRAVLIKSEDFKRYENPNFFKSFSVENVYDLYEVYSRIKNAESVTHFSRDLFNISLLCGNLIIFIDGFDELISIFQDNFKIESFIESLVELNRQLGQAKIIVTSREYYWIENAYIEEIQDEIDEIYLLGFDEDTWKKYLDNRFENYPDKEKYIEKIKKYINVSKLTDDGIVIPFFVDVLSGLAVDEYSSFTSDFKLDFSNRDYHSNDLLIDYLVYVLLDREIVRQGYNITLNQFISIFKDLASEFGSKFSVDNIEDVVELYFGVSSKDIYSRMRVNPLLRFHGNFVSFKYDFLSNYFITLYLIDCIIDNTINRYFVKHLSYLFNGKSQIINDVSLFLSRKKTKSKYISDVLSNLVSLHKNDEKFNKSQVEKSISSVMYILQLCNGAGLSRQRRMELIKEAYKNDKIDRFFIWSDFFQLDLSNTSFWNSKFINYSRFCKCKFKNTLFYYCSFDGIDISEGCKDIDDIQFDPTCDIGNLSQLINKDDLKRATFQLVEEELKKFFRSFYNRSVFINKLIVQITFSHKVSKINKHFLSDLVKENKIIYDNIGKRYSIAPTFQRSVHQFLVNNFVDNNINAILSLLCS